MEVYFARQPIMDQTTNVYGYELLYRNSPVPAPYSGKNGDISTSEVINNSFFGGDPYAMFNDKLIFVNFTENLLLNKTPTLLPAELLVIEILEEVTPTDEVMEACRSMKKKGYKFALDDYIYSPRTGGFLEFADYVKLDLQMSKPDLVRTSMICRKRGIKLLAEKVETDEDLAFAKTLGCVLMQGYYFAKPLIVTKQTASPMQLTFLRLVAMLNNDDVDLRHIAKIIEVDSAMTMKLLRVVNAVRQDWMEKVTSVLHAVRMLGLKRIKEWLYLVGLQQLKAEGADEFITMAFFRAKFCELVAHAIPDIRPHAQEFYLMGLISVISSLTNDDIADRIDEFPVSENIKKGLKGTEDTYRDVFALALSYERAEWEVVDYFSEKYKISQKSLTNYYITSLKASEQLMHTGVSSLRPGTGRRAPTASPQ
ncbi:MAG: HDOD domain-containing protein [Oscillospiraceae bacterium]